VGDVFGRVLSNPDDAQLFVALLALQLVWSASGLWIAARRGRRFVADLRLWQAMRASRTAQLTPGRVVVRGRARKLASTLNVPGEALHAVPGPTLLCLAYELPRREVGVARSACAPFVVELDGLSLLVDASALRVAGPVRPEDNPLDVRVIQDGDPVVVCGVAARVLDPAGPGASYREPPTRWVLHAHAAALVGDHARRDLGRTLARQAAAALASAAAFAIAIAGIAIGVRWLCR
jgi:hypothetical protein